MKLSADPYSRNRWAIVGPTYPYKGGIAQHTTELAERLESHGDIVEVQTWKRQYPNRLYPGLQMLDEPERRPFHRVERCLAWDRPDTWWRVGSAVGRRNDAVVLVLVSPLQFPAYEVLARAARRQGASVLAIIHNVLPHERRRIDVALARRLYSRLDSAIVHSHAELELALDLGLRHAVVASLPYFFESGHHRRIDVSRRDQLAFLGFVRPYKGLDVLIDALGLTVSRPRLIVRGEFWDGLDAYLELAQRRGVADRCAFIDEYASPDDFARTILDSDALVVPYRSATGSQHPRLARALGVPCIATHVGDMATQLIDGCDGYIVPPEDPVALAAAIDRLYAPGVIDVMSTTVRPVDVEGEWKAYVSALRTAVRGGPPGIGGRSAQRNSHERPDMASVHRRDELLG